MLQPNALDDSVSASVHASSVAVLQQREHEKYELCCGPSSSSRTSSGLSMQQTQAPGDTEAVYVCSSSVAALNLELSTDDFGSVLLRFERHLTAPRRALRQDELRGIRAQGGASWPT
eukprot:6908783-Pyramimonas_sp.AAC.1